MHKDSQLGMDFLRIHSEFDVASPSAMRRERKCKANAGFPFWPNSESVPAPGRRQAVGLGEGRHRQACRGTTSIYLCQRS